ncbi:hypothetical protein DYB34_004555, partial [Aphanomyces astaci]
DNSLPFMTLVEKKLRVIEDNIEVFGSDPSVFHCCHEDEQQENGLLYQDT